MENPFTRVHLKSFMGLKKKNPGLITVLRETMAKVEQTPGVDADDPALIELKCILNRRVAALENSMAAGNDAQQNRHAPKQSARHESSRQETENSMSS
jgi:hypothetical protein